MSSPGGSLSHSKRLNSGTDVTKVDDEHRLIARYVERLAGVANNALQLHADSQLKLGFDETQEKHHLVAELEAKNREILREIQRLRLEQQQQQQVAASGGGRSDFDFFVYGASAPYNSNSTTPLAVELHLLRQRRDELELRMRALQGSRRELMMQLEGLMKLLKNPLTPWSTPTSSPRSNNVGPLTTTSVGGHSMIHTCSNSLNNSLAAVSSDVRHAFSYQQHQQQQQQQHQHLSTSSGGGGGFNVQSYLRKDLFSATDSVTDAVSSLVKELNSEDSGTSESNVFERRKVGGGSLLEKSPGGLAHSPEKRRAKSNDNHFIPDIHLQNRSSSVSSGPASFIDPEGENEGFLTADDDEDNEEAALRWTTDRSARFDVTNELYDQNPRELIQRSRHMTTDEESCHETDQESYIRTDDDDDGGNTEWEDALKRWVNR